KKNENKISGGEIFGQLFILGQNYSLVLPPQLSGRIKSFSSNENIFDVAFKDEIMTVLAENLTTSQKKESSQHTHDSYIKASMDGLFYISPSPQSPPFVKIGDEIKPGQTIGLIEVMKSFYPMKYQGNTSVCLVDILIENATPISCGIKIYRVK
ncbi:MAG: hypothetical protein KC505_07205, partial [Myxococcales bacterium]|nr:hypothetical protein [Myxococcales bacterium]